MKICSIADLHLDHPRVSATHMRISVGEHVHPHIKDSQLLFIAGDVYDRLMKSDAIQTFEAHMCIQELLQCAKASGCKVRILRGTYTHDRNQLGIVDILNEPIGADLRIFSDVKLEYIEDLNLKVCYIPDNLPYTDSNACIESIQDMMTQLGWSTVDFVIGHGYFEHVLPYGIPKQPHCTFNINQFKDWVTEYVLMGHVHTSSKKKNVIYHGSFERLNHGEEEAKGFLILEKKNDKFIHTFIRNTSAIPFITIYPSGNNFEELLKDLESQILEKFGITPYGHLRIGLSDTLLRQLLVEKITGIHGTNLIVSGLNTDKLQKKQLTINTPHFEECVQIEPTEETIPSLVKEHMESLGGKVLSEDVIRMRLQNLN